MVKVQPPRLAFSDTTTGRLERIPHYCQVKVEIMLPPWLLLTVVGVSMVSSSGVFWTRAFIGEIKFLCKRALIVKVSVMLGCLFLALWQERVGFPWDFFHLCPLLFVHVGFFSTQSELLRKQKEASGHSSPV